MTICQKCVIEALLEHELRVGSSPDVTEARLRGQEYLKLWPGATGSLSLRQSPCVRTSCPACERGDGHASYALYGTDLLPGSISRCRISICGPRCRRK